LSPLLVLLPRPPTPPTHAVGRHCTKWLTATTTATATADLFAIFAHLAKMLGRLLS